MSKFAKFNKSYLLAWIKLDDSELCLKFITFPAFENIYLHCIFIIYEP